MRTFKFKLLTQAQLEEFSTNATTLGEMKSEIRRNPDLLRKFGVNPTSNLDEVQFIERSTKTTYNVNDAILPTSDATMFVSVIKSKAGYSDDAMSDILDDVDELSRTELEEIAEELNDENGANIDLDGSKSNLYEAVVDFIQEKLEEEETPEAGCCNERNIDELINSGYALLGVLLNFLAESQSMDSAVRRELQAESERLQSYFDQFRKVQ